MPLTPEQQAREVIDAALTTAGWVVQTADQVNLSASRGVAVCEFPLAKGHGHADYALFVDGKAAGIVEAKKAGVALSGVEVQAEKYATGFPASFPAHRRPLPFLYLSTGVETRFINLLDPEPRSRRVFSFHRPETLAAWLEEEPLWLPLVNGKPQPESQRPATLRARLRHLPALDEKGLWPAQARAIRNLELSLAADRPRALIQMATGSGKTFTAVSSIYRLVKEAKARRVLFLVDRGNLGRQALKEFQQYVTPDDGRKFTDLFNVQLLTSNKLDPVARVCICTIQRLYSMLKGEELPPELDEASAFTLDDLRKDPVPVAYNPAIPIETFDFIWTDEAHRSIYNLWRQVLEYFDSYLVGLTATPSKQTFGFFDQNLVQEYGHEAAVADGCNVDFTVYRIRTRIGEGGATVEAENYVDKRERDTRKVRWEKLDEPFTYEASDLNRDVVAPDQIRTVVRTFKDRLFTEIFPGRTEVPKTLIFAVDDAHADDIVKHVREVFGRGNEFCEKITYRTGTARVVDPVTGAVTYKSTGVQPEHLLSAFRNSFNPRIVVTVDMIATGTDVKPLEVVMFMRSVRSRNFFEQMKGRGVRVIDDADLQAVTPDARTKDHFVIVDAVGVCETEMMDSKPLEKNPTVSFEKLVNAVTFGNTSTEIVSSLASRLARLSRQLGKAEQGRIAELAGGVPLPELVQRLVTALDPDRHIEEARAAGKLPKGAEPAPEAVAKAAAALLKEAVAPLATNPKLRNALVDLKSKYEQTIDTVTQDELLEAGYSAEAREKAKGLVADFEKFIEQNKDEIVALQVLYSQPYARRLRFKDIRALAEAIQAPPRSWTPDLLWRAYEQLDRSKVRGAGAKRLLTDVVSLVRYALHRDPALVPFVERVETRYQAWLAQQANRGQRFTPEQLEWLAAIKDHVATSFGIEKDDFDEVPFSQKGGLGRVYALFGEELEPMLEELNEVLVA
ncbi:MAG: DEAD/DEAH box helicase family protein [Deltaproteobacteria bacterium]|nr:DEAD/DEAH box helicase family protein [Deltaproteobacteria bacterium]